MYLWHWSGSPQLLSFVEHWALVADARGHVARFILLSAAEGPAKGFHYGFVRIDNEWKLEVLQELREATT